MVGAERDWLRQREKYTLRPSKDICQATGALETREPVPVRGAELGPLRVRTRPRTGAEPNRVQWSVSGFLNLY